MDRRIGALYLTPGTRLIIGRSGVFNDRTGLQYGDGEMDLGLAGKRGIVVGGSRGIGKAIALELAREGVDLVISARTEDELARTAREISAATGRRVLPMPLDAKDRDRVETVIDDAAQELGGLNILINSGSRPGGSPTATGRINTIVDEDFLDDFDTKYMGALRCARAAIPHLKAAG